LYFNVRDGGKKSYVGFLFVVDGNLVTLDEIWEALPHRFHHQEWRWTLVTQTVMLLNNCA
jgi:hypothetical protein